MKSNTAGFFIIAIILLGSCFLSFNLLLKQRSAQDKLDIRVFPYEISEWQGEDIEVSEKDYKILETRNLILREYSNPEGDKLSLFIVYSETNRSVFHPPEVCFIGSGVNIANKETEKINSGKREFLVNKLWTEKGNSRGLALYCYKSGDLYTENFYLQQASFALNQLLGKHKNGATIRVSMGLRQDKEKSLNTLKTFLKSTIKVLDSLSM